MPLRDARHLEVHVAEMILVAKDVREHGDVVALFDQPHRDPCDRRADRNSRRPSSARDDPQTVAIDDDPFDSRVSDTTRTV